MGYFGGKLLLKKYILPIIQNRFNKSNCKYFIETFCGMCSIISNIKAEKKIAYDINPYLIALLKAIKDKSYLKFPKVISKKLYQEIKHNKQNFDDSFVGYVGFEYSFGGNFFSSYIDKYHCKHNIGRIAYHNGEIAFRRYQILSNNIQDIKFECLDYRDAKIPNNSFLYCDPPYSNGKDKKGYFAFNNYEFWEWVRTKDNIIISEEDAPKEFMYIFQKKMRRCMNNKVKKQKFVFERLFIKRKLKKL